MQSNRTFIGSCSCYFHQKVITNRIVSVFFAMSVKWNVIAVFNFELWRKFQLKYVLLSTHTLCKLITKYYSVYVLMASPLWIYILLGSSFLEAHVQWNGQWSPRTRLGEAKSAVIVTWQWEKSAIFQCE